MSPKTKLLFRRYSIVLGFLALTAASDLWSKRWAERNLATGNHLIPVAAHSFTGAQTVGDLVRSKWPDLTDEDLEGNVRMVKPGFPVFPEMPLSRLVAQGIYGLYVFDHGNLDTFARYIGFPQSRETAEAPPAKIFADLDSITLDSFLAKQLPHLSAGARLETIRQGIFPARGASDLVSPRMPVQKDAIYLVAKREIVLIPGHLDFSYTENPAGAWGLFSSLDDEKRRPLFIVVSLVALVVLVYLLVRPPSERFVSLAALGGILGGAFGNVVDRFSNHYVVDFIHMYWGEYHWPRYNIADIGITVGVIIMLLFDRKRKATKPPKGSKA